MKKVLVTGANGFIGRQCLPLLIARGFEVHATALENDLLSQPDLHWHNADLLDKNSIDSLVSKIRPSHLLHFAWYTEHKKYWTAPENHIWSAAGLDLISAFQSCGGKRAVMAGSCAEYDWKCGCCREDTTPLSPATLYGVCKNELRQSAEKFSAMHRMSFAWGRIFFVYGPGEHPGRLVPSVIRSLLRGSPAACSDGRQVRDFLYVEDVASAFACLLESDVQGAVNIASGVPVTVKEIIDMIAEKIGRPDLIEFGRLPAPPGDPLLLSADAAKLKKEAGWFPEYTLSLGLDKTIAWWKERL
ncbi:MAG: NAD(P)-dependent oxidoreductase [Candidatus Omnitrophota bacterium]